MCRKALVKNEICHSELLSALKWYFESKNLALKNALKLRCQLSVEQQRELRQYYSGYFAGLISATELLRDQGYSYSDKFKRLLADNFVFDLLPNGASNYSYIRVLRNSIIHRGLDICSTAHVKDDFPLVVAPSSVSDRDGTSFKALGFYLLDVISKCENVIGPLIARHLEEVELLTPTMVNRDQAVEETRRFISESEVMPEWAKQLSYKSIASIDFVAVQMAEINSLVEVLRFNALSSFAAEQVAPSDGRQAG